MRIVTASQMKQIERNALEYQMTNLRLMENAGCAAARIIEDTLHTVENLECVTFCGKGNNGGDGFVVARKLAESGATVTMILCDGEPVTDEAVQMYRLACSMGLPVYHLEEDEEGVQAALETVDIVVDAIYGSGFHGEFDSPHRKAALLMNSAIAAVFALDLPSGLCCDTGECAEDIVQADFTIAFDSYKPAHMLEKHLPQLGRIFLAPIGVDPQAYEGLEPLVFVSDESVLSKIPAKDIDAHKTSTGKLLNIAGEVGHAGAVVLSSKGALRCGAGYVVTGVPRDIYQIVAPLLLQSPFIFIETAEDVAGALPGVSAVSIGCGIGVGSRQAGILEAVLRQAKCPVVIDADGINNLASNINILAGADCPLILTPHMGEAARLCRTTVEEVKKAPLRCAKKLAEQLGAVLVLKGANTVIASPEGKICINQTGNPGLAKAGSGDVLTGMITALLSQGMEAFDAAVCGVYLHGLAADLCAKRLSVYSMQPDDILTDLGRVFLEHLPM